MIHDLLSVTRIDFPARFHVVPMMLQNDSHLKTEARIGPSPDSHWTLIQKIICTVVSVEGQIHIWSHWILPWIIYRMFVNPAQYVSPWQVLNKMKTPILTGAVIQKSWFKKTCFQRSMFLLLSDFNRLPIHPVKTWLAIYVAQVQCKNTIQITTADLPWGNEKNLLTSKSNYVLPEPLFSWFMTPAPLSLQKESEFILMT